MLAMAMTGFDGNDVAPGYSLPCTVGGRYLDRRVSLRGNDVTSGPGHFLT
jgi:hypothetical protein